MSCLHTIEPSHETHPSSNSWKDNRPRRQRGRRKPQRRFPPEVLSDREIAALIDACKDNTPASLRNRALIAVLYRAGLRITEALALRPIDVDPQNGAIRILHAKGGRSRTVGMDAMGFERLERWLQARSSLAVGDDGALFCLVNGKPMQSCYVRVFLPRIAKKAGILRRVHAHGFRHTHAAELRGEGVDIGVISKQLGHRSIATTARYLDHIAPWDVVNAMRKREWQA